MKKINLLYIADTPHLQELGLQHIKSLPENTGMLFKFQSPKILNFWMKNTYLPLEIAFIDHNGIVVKTDTMIPMSLRSVSSGRPCSMALEVESGLLKKLNIQIGSKVKVDFKDKAVIFDETN